MKEEIKLFLLMIMVAGLIPSLLIGMSISNQIYLNEGININKEGFGKKPIEATLTCFWWLIAFMSLFTWMSIYSIGIAIINSINLFS